MKDYLDKVSIVKIMSFEKKLRQKNNKRRWAFTFIEFLIYSAIASVVITSFILININLIKAGEKNMAMEEISYNATFSMDMIAKAVREAESINSPTEQDSSSELSLETRDPLKNPIIFSLVDGSIQLTEGVESSIITSESVVIDELEFINITRESTPGTIRIKMTIKPYNPLEREGLDIIRTFYLTENIRI